MFKIKGKENGVVWDVNSNKPLIKFKNGMAETEDKKVAEQLKELGFIVEGETQEKQDTKKEKSKNK